MSCCASSRRPFDSVEILALGVGEPRFEIALARGERGCPGAGLIGGGSLGSIGFVELGDASLPGLDRLRVRAKCLIDLLELNEQLDLRRQRLPTSLQRWAQCDSNTRPTGYEPAALTT